MLTSLTHTTVSIILKEAHPSRINTPTVLRNNDICCAGNFYQRQLYASILYKQSIVDCISNRTKSVQIDSKSYIFSRGIIEFKINIFIHLPRVLTLSQVVIQGQPTLKQSAFHLQRLRSHSRPLLQLLAKFLLPLSKVVKFQSVKYLRFWSICCF